jgi:hypothetical protein
MHNPWELYSGNPGFAEATQALERAWEEAKALEPSKPSAERAKLAERYVYEVMKRHRHVGSMDSEPCSVLRWRVEKHFGVAGGYL